LHANASAGLAKEHVSTYDPVWPGLNILPFHLTTSGYNIRRVQGSGHENALHLVYLALHLSAPPYHKLDQPREM